LSRIRIAIIGYGNIGKGVELAIAQNPDMELVAVVTRRNPSQLKISNKSAAIYSMEQAATLKTKVDVAVLCGGSAVDLPKQGPVMAALFNTVDSFDTHARIPDYFNAMDKAAAKNKHISIISVGWDPGMFSINRLYSDSILATGRQYTFWGRGVSQGHSDAIRNVEGVRNAIQYTVPIAKAIAAVRSGLNPRLTTRQKHIRECYVVAEAGANKAQIAQTIKTMPNYFADYITKVHFISETELQAKHHNMPHGGFVIHSGRTGRKSRHLIEYSLKLDSNPEFTACVLVCYARAAYRLAKNGGKGAKTVFDVAPTLLSAKSSEELRAQLL
jgi:diaminopimelate dehydrogenase